MFGKINIKFLGLALSNQIHLTLDQAHCRDTFMVGPKSYNQLFYKYGIIPTAAKFATSKKYAVSKA